MHNLKDGLAAYSRKLEWSNGSGSDLFAILNVYKVWSLKHNQREFGLSDEQKRREVTFSKRHSVDTRSLRDCHLLVNELTRRLANFDIKEQVGVNRAVWKENEKSIILKVVIAGDYNREKEQVHS